MMWEARLDRGEGKILLIRRPRPTHKQHLVGRVIHADVLGILSLLAGLEVCESSTRSA